MFGCGHVVDDGGSDVDCFLFRAVLSIGLEEVVDVDGEEMVEVMEVGGVRVTVLVDPLEKPLKCRPVALPG